MPDSAFSYRDLPLFWQFNAPYQVTPSGSKQKQNLSVVHELAIWTKLDVYSSSLSYVAEAKSS